MSGPWFHVDLDAFFASVEQLDDPSLRGKPVIVGARPGGRGVVSTCSYEARAYGVHSAMPIGEAYRRCPTATFLPGRMERYSELSCKVMGILGDFSPDVSPISIDEAFLDMGGMELLWGSPEDAARSLKARVRTETGLGISVGVASNRYVAKIASGIRKPDGLVIIAPGAEAEFMRSLPLSKLWGAGEKTQERFRDLGIRSIDELVSLGEAELTRLFGQAGGRFLAAAAQGTDVSIFGGRPTSRSLSSETTFERDVVDAEALEAALLEMSYSLLFRLWHEGLRSRTLVLKLRLADFSTASRRITKARDYRDSGEVYADALELLGRLWNGKEAVRLIGLGLSELSGRAEPRQSELFPDEARRRKLEQAIFDISERGLAELRPARLLGGSRRPGRGPRPHPEGGARGQ